MATKQHPAAPAADPFTTYQQDFPDYEEWLDRLNAEARADAEWERRIEQEYAARGLTAAEKEANARAESLFDQTVNAY